MATKKVTITLDEKQLEMIRALVASGSSSSVSGFVQHAVQTAIDDSKTWAEMLDEWLDETGGPMTDEERAWADEMLGIAPSKQQKKPPAA